MTRLRSATQEESFSPFNFNASGALEVHNVGEIWTMTLWEVRSRIIAANGGNVPVGNQIALQLVTDGMKLTPDQPSFIDARDALIDADCAANPSCPNEESIWNGFADRGLGYKSIAELGELCFSDGIYGVGESFQPANLDIDAVTVNDTIGNNTGAIDPNEPVLVQVNLKNPWVGTTRTATGVNATISSSTPGVVIQAANTTYPNIAPNSNASANGSALRIQAPPAAACGSSINLTLTIQSLFGQVVRNFTIRIGQATGQATDVFTRTNSGLLIQDPRFECHTKLHDRLVGDHPGFRNYRSRRPNRRSAAYLSAILPSAFAAPMDMEPTCGALRSSA